MTPTICVLIRAKNEAKDIGKAIELVLDQTLPAEVIVVDSGSTDGTLDIVRQYPTVRLIEMPAAEFSFGRSLNLGIAATSAEIVVALSAHAFPCDRHWLENFVRHFNNPQVAGVYGRQVPHPDAYPPVKRDCLDYYGTAPRIQTNPGCVNDREFSNANSAIRRSCWQEQPFDEKLPYSEDQVWALAMLKRNYHLCYEPEASVFHSHNETLDQVFRRCYREAVASRTLYNRQMSLKSALIGWSFAVLWDTLFILQHKQDYGWLFRSPIYRFFSIYGEYKSGFAKLES